MGLICNTNAQDQKDLIAKAKQAEGLEVIHDPSEKHWPYCITDGEIKVYIEGRAFLAWGGQDFGKIQAALETVGIYITTID